MSSGSFGERTFVQGGRARVLPGAGGKALAGLEKCRLKARTCIFRPLEGGTQGRGKRNALDCSLSKRPMVQVIGRSRLGAQRISRGRREPSLRGRGSTRVLSTGRQVDVRDRDERRSRGLVALLLCHPHTALDL